MALSYNLKDWKRLSDEAWTLGSEFFQLFKTIVQLLRQGTLLSKDLAHFGWEIVQLLRDVVQSSNIRQWQSVLSALMRRFLSQTQK